MQRMLPVDHFNMLFETEKSPMNIGAMMLFDVAEDQKSEFAGRVRAHLERHVPRSVLARRLIQAPEHYDNDTWFAMRAADALRQIREVGFDKDLSDEDLRTYVTRRGMQALDLSKAPFELDIIPQVTGPRCAIYFKMHHGVMDGVGFQKLIEHLSDAGVGALTGEAAEADEPIPSPEAWMAMAREKFDREAPERAAVAERKAAAEKQLAAFMADPANQRRLAPTMAFSSDFSDQRTYRTVAFELEPFRAVGKRFGATVNDVFLAVAAGGLRAHLLKRGQLPEAPLVSHSVRSIRREEHGPYGNWVLSIYPELATDEPDPVLRLQRIRESMNAEKQRSLIEEQFYDEIDWPYGARDRRAICADAAKVEAAIGPANAVLSNVPGPAERLTFAGFPMSANYAVPIVGPGRFLNITSRRNADALQMGVMVDAAKILDADDLIACLQAAFDELAARAQE